MRLARGDRLVIASHNTGKVAEIADLVRPWGLAVEGAGDLGLGEPEETGATFTENAAIKARAAALAAGVPALADDSGLLVDILDGAPGIYSARLAGLDRNFALAMEKLKDLIVGAGGTLTPEAGPESPTARFVCALTVAWPGEGTHGVVGEVAGAIVWPPRGHKGFGYDPVFQPAGYDETFGEMEPQAKHRISHRAHAFAKLEAELFDDAG